MGPGAIEYLVTYFRMGAIDAPVELSAKKNAAANAVAYCDVNEASAGDLRSQHAPPRAAASASFSTATGRSNPDSSSATRFPPCHPGSVPTSPITPVNGASGPGHPTPIPAWCVPPSEMSRNIAIMRRIACSKPFSGSAGHTRLLKIVPSSRIAPTAIFVPPISTDPIVIMLLPPSSGFSSTRPHQREYNQFRKSVSLAFGAKGKLNCDSNPEGAVRPLCLEEWSARISSVTLAGHRMHMT